MELPSPALHIDRELLDRNIDAVLSIAGERSRLWPHIKTYKSSRLIMRLQGRGITRFKAATTAEATLLGVCGVREALLAYPVTGPAIEALAAIACRYRRTRFSCLVEDMPRLEEIERHARRRGVRLGIFIDVDPGQGRTGTDDPGAIGDLAVGAHASGAVDFLGLHVYDGQNHQSDLSERTAAADRCLALVERLRRRLPADGDATVIMGGTPTFPIYAERSDSALSPGTAFLFDAGYRRMFPDLPFVPAATVRGRIVSVPRRDVVTVDIGTKAIATDPAGPRGEFVDLDVAESLIHNEEHWVVRLAGAGARPSPGDTVSVIPTHICPTVNLYNQVFLTDRSGVVTERWPIDGRDRVPSR